MLSTGRKRGLTLIELLIAVAVVGIILVLGSAFLIRSCSDSKEAAEEEARAYARSMNLNAKGVSCMTRDTDGDGYVSCSISVLGKDGSERVEPVECASRWSWNNSGCKVPMTRVQRGIR